MELERKIEKLLRAYAKKRRAAAGDAFTLHPATRRLLQGEVARRTPPPDGEDEPLSLWDLFRRQWAVPVGFALIILVGASLVLSALGKARVKSERVVAMSNLKQIGMAVQMAAADNNGRLPATLDALTNTLGTDKTLTDPESGRRFVYAAGGQALDELRGDDVLAYSPGDKKDRAVLFADGSVQRFDREKFSELTNRGLPEFALAENQPREQGKKLSVATAPAPAPAAAPPAVVPENNLDLGYDTSGVAAGLPAASVVAPGTASRAGSSEVAQNSLYFRTVAQTNAGQLALNNNSQRFIRAVVGKAQPVLASFEFQQNGSALAVVDHDGSVYNGTLKPAAPAVLDDLSKANEQPADRRAWALQTAQKDLGVVVNTALPAQNYSFRVAGFNRTLNQNVVFTGNVIGVSNVTSDVAQNFRNQAVSGQTGQLQPANANAAQAQALFANSRIEGTATIGRTNQIEINAVPVTQ